MKKNLSLCMGILLLGGAIGLSSCGKTTTTSTDATTPTDGAKTEVAAEVPAADAAAADEKVTQGTFVEVEWGDYPHFNMTNDKGEEISFWLAPDLPSDQIEKFESGEKKGAKIEVKWRVAKRDIPESGGMMELEEIFAIREL